MTEINIFKVYFFVLLCFIPTVINANNNETFEVTISKQIFNSKSFRAIILSDSKGNILDFITNDNLSKLSKDKIFVRPITDLKICLTIVVETYKLKLFTYYNIKNNSYIDWHVKNSFNIRNPDIANIIIRDVGKKCDLEVYLGSNWQKIYGTSIIKNDLHISNVRIRNIGTLLRIKRRNYKDGYFLLAKNEFDLELYAHNLISNLSKVKIKLPFKDNWGISVHSFNPNLQSDVEVFRQYPSIKEFEKIEIGYPQFLGYSQFKYSIKGRLFEKYGIAEKIPTDFQYEVYENNIEYASREGLKVIDIDDYFDAQIFSYQISYRLKAKTRIDWNIISKIDESDIFEFNFPKFTDKLLNEVNSLKLIGTPRALTISNVKVNAGNKIDWTKPHLLLMDNWKINNFVSVYKEKFILN